MAENGANGTESYTPRAILITGGAGFIASHVAIRLTKLHPDYKAGHPPLSKA